MCLPRGHVYVSSLLGGECNTVHAHRKWLPPPALEKQFSCILCVSKLIYDSICRALHTQWQHGALRVDYLSPLIFTVLPWISALTPQSRSAAKTGLFYWLAHHWLKKQYLVFQLKKYCQTTQLSSVDWKMNCSFTGKDIGKNVWKSVECGIYLRLQTSSGR